MTTVPIERIELLASGRLELIVGADPDDLWKHIYRAAAEIQWDPKHSRLLSPRPELGPAPSHFAHVAQAAADELGYRITPTPTTVWVGVSDEDRTTIEAFRPAQFHR